MSTQTQKTVIVVFDTRVSVHELIGRVKTVVSVMTGNSYFATPNPPLATITTDVNALDAAQTVALTKVKGAAAERNTKLVIVRNDLHTLKAYVQTVANADPANADAIILSAGMSIKQTTSHAKQDLAAKPGDVSGTVKVVAKAAADRASYDWQTSTDLKTWVQLPSTLQAHTSVPNLPPGTTAYFRNRAVTKSGVGDWSEPTSIIVQ